MQLALFTQMVTAASPKPHLIFALVDDWGWWDVGFRGNDLIHTPTIDNLVAKEAALLERHCACPPRFTPLITG